jgi:4-hydroxy-3-methylbut-2-enyl diphosphate reductase
MIVNVDRSAGFCWGVVRAIDFAEKELNKSPKIYSLGDVIHNKAEIQRLNELGLDTITVDEFSKIEKGSKVLIRAHGEPPSTYKEALKYGIEIIDATCPVVTKVQERIRKFYLGGYQIVIFGKKDHAEVIGLNGVTENNAVIIQSVEEAIKKVELTRSTVLFSQTTMDKEVFAQVADALKSKIKELHISSIEEEAVEFHAKSTICGQVSGRDKRLREFARSNDVIVFVAGRKSSNGKVLFDIAREENLNTYFVEDEKELLREWFKGVKLVGISGATSTPQWQMEKIKSFIMVNFTE